MIADAVVAAVDAVVAVNVGVVAAVHVAGAAAAGDAADAIDVVVDRLAYVQHDEPSAAAAAAVHDVDVLRVAFRHCPATAAAAVHDTVYALQPHSRAPRRPPANKTHGNSPEYCYATLGRVSAIRTAAADSVSPASPEFSATNCTHPPGFDPRCVHRNFA